MINTDKIITESFSLWEVSVSKKINHQTKQRIKELLAQDYTYQQIADELGIGFATVARYGPKLAPPNESEIDNLKRRVSQLEEELSELREKHYLHLVEEHDAELDAAHD